MDINIILLVSRDLVMISGIIRVLNTPQILGKDVYYIGTNEKIVYFGNPK